MTLDRSTPGARRWSRRKSSRDRSSAAGTRRRPRRRFWRVPAGELIERHRDALANFSAAIERLAPLLEEITIATVRDALPTAHRLEVLGEMNEDWAWTLRIQRVLDAAGTVLFDIDTGAEADVEDHIHEVGVDYLDLLLEITGEDYFGRQEIEA